MYLICPCLYSYWYPLYSASLGQPGQCTYLPVFVLVLVPLVQCFAWSARAMYVFARVRTRTVRESLHSVYCACTPCTAFPWASAANVPSLPVFVLVLYLYPLYGVSLGPYGKCTYLPVFVLVTVLVLVQCLVYVLHLYHCTVFCMTLTLCL